MCIGRHVEVMDGGRGQTYSKSWQAKKTNPKTTHPKKNPAKLLTGSFPWDEGGLVTLNFCFNVKVVNFFCNS